MITPSFEGHEEDVLMSLLSEYGIRSSTTEFSLTLTTYIGTGVYVVISRFQYFAFFATEFSLL